MAEGRRHFVEINVESLVSSLEKGIEYHNRSISCNYCIFKTPSILLRHNEDAYHPHAFSFGPFHFHANPALIATEKIKFKYLDDLANRLQYPRAILLKDLINDIKEVGKEALECYAESTDVNMDKFLQILILDGCFIIELFRKDANEKLREHDDPVFNMSCMLQYLYHDLILLENQIPWLVLERLFNKTKRVDSENFTLSALALLFFWNMFTYDPPDPHLLVEKEFFSQHESKHILDLLRNWLVLPYKEEESKGEFLKWEALPSVTILKEAGIKFERFSSSSILDIKFNKDKGILQIPSLIIQETTETIFRNLISFEQCYHKCSPRLTSYAKIMDNLIDTTNDMKILCNNQIMDNWMNPEEAAQYFNKLYNDTYFREIYYRDLCKDVNEYCHRRWPRWRASYMHNYFGTPWAIVSQIFAAILLILAFLQTLFTIMK